MIKDIQPQANEWVDVYAATGIAVGTGLLVQAKTDALAYLWEGAAPPALGRPATGRVSAQCKISERRASLTA